MRFIGRLLPGELDGTFDPRDYGLGVIKDEPRSEAEDRLAIATLYRATRRRTEIEIPKLEEFLKDQPYDEVPARKLIERHDALPDPYECRFGNAQLEIDRGVF